MIPSYAEAAVGGPEYTPAMKFVLERIVTRRGALGRECTYRLLNSEGTEVFRGDARGRFLKKPLTLQAEEGPVGTLAADSRMTVRKFSLTDPAGAPLARFTLSALERGSVAIELAGGRELRFKPSVGLAADAMRALVLRDSHFVLTDGERVLGSTAAPGGTRKGVTGVLKRLITLPLEVLRALRSRGSFTPVGRFRVLEEDEAVDEILIGALLVLEREVVYHYRSP